MVKTSVHLDLNQVLSDSNIPTFGLLYDLGHSGVLLAHRTYIFRCSSAAGHENHLQKIVRQCFLFVMGPHPENFYRLDVLYDLINKAMFDIDPSGIGSLEFSNQPFIGWRILKWVVGKDC